MSALDRRSGSRALTRSIAATVEAQAEARMRAERVRDRARRVARVRRKYDTYLSSGEYDWFPMNELYMMPGGDTDDEIDARLAEDPNAEW
jgi:hypothetical protein